MRRDWAGEAEAFFPILLFGWMGFFFGGLILLMIGMPWVILGVVLMTPAVATVVLLLFAALRGLWNECVRDWHRVKQENEQRQAEERSNDGHRH